MIRGVLVDVLVADLLPRPDDERGAKLGDSLARLVHAVASLSGTARAREALRVEHQLQEPDRPHRRSTRRLAVVIDEDRERDRFFLDEPLGVGNAAGPDRDHLAVEALNLVVALAQLR